MGQEIAPGRDPRGNKVAATQPPRAGVEAQLAALTVAVRHMGDVLEEHTRQLRKLNELADDTDGNNQLLEVLQRIQETLSTQTDVLNVLETRTARPAAARAN